MITWVAVAMICTSPMSLDCSYVTYPKGFDSKTECDTEVMNFVTGLRESSLLAYGGCNRVEVNITLS